MNFIANEIHGLLNHHDEISILVYIPASSRQHKNILTHKTYLYLLVLSDLIAGSRLLFIEDSGL